MREIENRPEDDESIRRRLQESWDVGAISHALTSAPEPASDIAHGPGIRYHLADGAVTVELFPPHAERQSGIVRLSTSDARHEFFRQGEPAAREDGLIFQSGTQLLTLTATGEVTYRLLPSERHQKPVDAPDVSTDPLNPVIESESPRDDAVTSQVVVPDSDATPETQSRVTYSGRLGTDPRTKVTPKGKFVMEFPVSVTVADQAKPEWRHTVVFDAKARALDGVLHKGTAVEVIAYEHHKTKTDPDTTRRRDVREYYATSVTPKPRAGEPASEAPHAPQP